MPGCISATGATPNEGSGPGSGPKVAPRGPNVVAPEVGGVIPATARSLDTTLRLRSAAQFAGISISDTGQIEVHMVGGAESSSASNVYEALTAVPSDRRAPRAAVQIVDATANIAGLESRRDSFAGAAKELASEGIPIVSWGVDVRRNSLRVGLLAITAASTARIEGIVGKSNLDLTVDQPGENASRNTDSSPWYGGDWLDNPDGTHCTSGFTVFDGSGIRHNTTAGHCTAGASYQNGQGYGFTNNYSYGDHQIDGQTISTYPGTAAGVVFTSYSTATYVESQSYIQYAGEDVCLDGYYTGQSCGKVTLVNFCWLLSGNISCGLDLAQADYRLVQGGDSGGPVYSYNLNGLLNARGIIAGMQGSDGHTAFYTDITPMQNVLHVNVLPYYL